jgi:hypothetical protein
MTKIFYYYLSFLGVVNFGLFLKLRENKREINLKNEIYKQIKEDVISGDIKYKYYV